jgi:hypothetical protein
VPRGVPRPPFYPPGTSLALVPFVVLLPDYPLSVQLGAKFFALLYVVSVTCVAWLYGGAGAAALAALMVGLSPFAREMASFILSDALAAAFAVIVLGLVQRVSRTRVALAGVLAGALVSVRLNGIVMVVALLAATPKGRRRWAAGGAALPLAALGTFYWLTLGTPLKTGYRFPRRMFDVAFAIDNSIARDGPWIVGDALRGWLMDWVCPCRLGGPEAALPNLVYYPALLLGLFWVFAPPLASLPGVFEAWRRRNEAGAALTLWAVTLVVILHLVFFYQAARFLAPAATLLVVLSAACLARLLLQPARPVKPNRGRT